MRLQTQFLLLFLILFAVLVGQLLLNVSNQKENIDQVQNIRIDEFSQTFQEIIDLQISKSKLFAYDYSYWDEMVDFTRSHDLEWAVINLDEGIKTYESEYIYVYDNQKKLLYSGFDQKKYQTIAPLINPKYLDPEKPVLKNYFVVANSQPIQLFIAPIQHSDDLNRTGKPYGYLVIGKVWTPEFVHTFEQITKQSIRILPIAQADSAHYDIVHPLKGADEKTLCALGINLSTTASDTLHKMAQTNMTSILIVGSLGLLLFGWFIYRKIVLPLQQIAKAMHTQKNDTIQPLLQKEGEFGEIARLIEEFFEQRKKLSDTNQILEQKVEERTAELEAINRTLDERVRIEIAHRREQEQLLIHQSRFAAMGEMIGNIAHQWRQPLNSLSLLLQNIILAYETDRLDRAFMERLNDKGNFLIHSMSATIDDFRNFFKPNRDKESFNISDQLEKTLNMIQGSLENNQISVKKNIEPTLMMRGFPNEFSQVFLNLINNAKDALSEKSIPNKTILIRGVETIDAIILSVHDNGGGIPDTIIEKIFDPYFTTKEEGKGTGIGLYMSKVIVETNMNGILSVANDSEGCIFTLRFQKSLKSDPHAY